MELEKLKDPFPEDQVEWRIAQCGKKGNGHIWATCLAYIQARAVMDRLDDVCGISQWKVSYEILPSGIMCRLSINCSVNAHDEWVEKHDGAESTDIEPFKGGISGALKRAASVWGIGRYLYGLETGFANITQERNGAKWGKTKEGHEFYWTPPSLPAWALPKGSPVGISAIHPSQPGPADGVQNADVGYRIPFGKFAKRALEEVDIDQLRNYVTYLEKDHEKTGKQMTPAILDFVQRAALHIVAFENEVHPTGFHKGVAIY